MPRRTPEELLWGLAEFMDSPDLPPAEDERIFAKDYRAAAAEVAALRAKLAKARDALEWYANKPIKHADNPGVARRALEEIDHD